MREGKKKAGAAHALSFELERAERAFREAEREHDRSKELVAELAQKCLASAPFGVAQLAYHDARCIMAYRNGELSGVKKALALLSAETSGKVGQLKMVDDDDDGALLEDADANADADAGDEANDVEAKADSDAGSALDIDADVDMETLCESVEIVDEAA